MLRGEDLTAWEDLDRTDAEALKAFIVAWPASPLAERAWTALVALGPVDPAWSRDHRELVDALERSRQTHAEALARTPTVTAVAPLDAEGEPPELRAPWTVHALAGAGLDETGPGGSLGVMVGRGVLAGVVRGQVGRRSLAELVVRVHPDRLGVAFGEIGVDTVPRGVARVGASVPLSERVHLDSSLGVALGADGLAPVVRLEVGHAWALPSRGVSRRRTGT